MKKNRDLILSFGVLCSLLILATFPFLYSDALSQDFWIFFPVYSLQFVFFTGIIWVLARKKPKDFLIPIVLVGILLRMLLWFSEPVLEDDYYRYFWDGHVQAHGINPYEFPPKHKALDGIDAEYRSRINYPHVPTIYPPVTQFLFRFLNFLAPGSLLALKIILTLFDLLTGFILVLWLRKLKLPDYWSALYFLNPLVLKEIANSAHFDSLPVLLSFSAVFLFVLNRSFLAWVLLALSASSKIYALAFFPLFFKLDPFRWRHALVFIFAFTVLYLPFGEVGYKVLLGTEKFAKYWDLNGSIFSIFKWAQTSLGGGEKTYFVTKIMMVFFYFISYGWIFLKTKNREALSWACLWVLGFMMIFSSVVNSWYILWLLPFAILEGHLAWLVFGFLVGVSYYWTVSYEDLWKFQWVEYSVFYGLLFFGRGLMLYRKSVKRIL